MTKVLNVIKNDKEITINVDISFIIKNDISRTELEFLEYFIKKQIDVGLDEWVIVRAEDVMQDLDTKRTTALRWFRHLRDINIIVQENYRTPLWKLNFNMVEVSFK